MVIVLIRCVEATITKLFLGTEPVRAFFLEVHDKMGQRSPNRFYCSSSLERSEPMTCGHRPRVPFKWVGCARRESFLLRRVAEVLLARGPGPENELTDPGPPVRLIMETLDGHLGLRARALNLSLIIEENGHVTALSKL